MRPAKDLFVPLAQALLNGAPDDAARERMVNAALPLRLANSTLLDTLSQYKRQDPVAVQIQTLVTSEGGKLFAALTEEQKEYNKEQLKKAFVASKASVARHNALVEAEHRREHPKSAAQAKADEEAAERERIERETAKQQHKADEAAALAAQKAADVERLKREEQAASTDKERERLKQERLKAEQDAEKAERERLALAAGETGPGPSGPSTPEPKSTDEWSPTTKSAVYVGIPLAVLSVGAYIYYKLKKRKEKLQRQLGVKPKPVEPGPGEPVPVGSGWGG